LVIVVDVVEDKDEANMLQMERSPRH